MNSNTWDLLKVYITLKIYDFFSQIILVSICIFQEDEYRDSVAIAQDMEENYGHYFDSVIPFDDVDYVFQQLMYEINLLEREPQWVPAKWVRAQQ